MITLIFVAAGAVLNPAAMAPGKQRILCLHGKGELGAPFLETFSALRQAAGPTVEWDAIDAPHVIGGGRAWWMLPAGERSFTAESYEGDEASLAVIDAAWREGDYDVRCCF